MTYEYYEDYDDFNEDYDDFDTESDYAYFGSAGESCRAESSVRQLSALRAATPDNPRNLSCPTCRTENVLTPKDRARGYQCNRCANIAEGGGFMY